MILYPSLYEVQKVEKSESNTLFGLFLSVSHNNETECDFDMYHPLIYLLIGIRLPSVMKHFLFYCQISTLLINFIKLY